MSSIIMTMLPVIFQIAMLAVLLFLSVRLIRESGRLLIVVFLTFLFTMWLLTDLYWVIYDYMRPDSRMPFAVNEIGEATLFLLMPAISGAVVSCWTLSVWKQVAGAIVFVVCNVALWIQDSNPWPSFAPRRSQLPLSRAQIPVARLLPDMGDEATAANAGATGRRTECRLRFRPVRSDEYHIINGVWPAWACPAVPSPCLALPCPILLKFLNSPRTFSSIPKPRPNFSLPPARLCPLCTFSSIPKSRPNCSLVCFCLFFTGYDRSFPILSCF